jgi:hypothetical protein
MPHVDPNVMLPAVFGLLGVIVGGLITAGANYILEERRANREEALARNKLRLDLFDRRYKIYEATSRFVDSINNDPGNVDSYLNAFNAGTSNAGFLFDADVVNYIKQVREKAVHMRTALTLYEAEERKSQPNEAERVRKRYEADRAWLIEQATAMTKTFTPYLGFQNVKA